MCNHYRADIKKLGLDFEQYGFEEFSETKIRQRLNDFNEDVFPDRSAVIGRLEGGKLVPTSMRWGFPPLPQKEGQPKPKIITNVRNLKSGYWRPWLKPEYRCIVPATSFAEWGMAQKRDVFFERTDGKAFAFAGIWRPWEGQRGTKKDPVLGDHLLFSFLTTEPNAVVAPIHPKAMPVILFQEDFDTWLNAPPEEALLLQRPAPDDAFRLVA